MYDILGAVSQNAHIDGDTSRVEPDADREEFSGAAAAAWQGLNPDNYPFIHTIVGPMNEHDDREQFLTDLACLRWPGRLAAFARRSWACPGCAQFCSGMRWSANPSSQRSVEGTNVAGRTTNLVIPASTKRSTRSRAAAQPTGTISAGSAPGLRLAMASIVVAGISVAATARLVP